MSSLPSSAGPRRPRAPARTMVQTGKLKPSLTPSPPSSTPTPPCPTEVTRLRDRGRRRRVLRKSPALIYELVMESDGALWFSFVSENVIDLLEVLPDRLENDADALLARVHPADRADFDQSLAISAREQSPWSWQGRIVLPSGRVQWFENQAQPEALKGSRVRWNGLLMPISPPDRLRSPVAGATLALGWSESVADQDSADLGGESAIGIAQRAVAALVENDPDFIGIADLAGHLSYINPSGLEMLGISSLAAVQGQPIERLFSPEDREIVGELIHPVALRDGQWHGAFRMWHEDRQVPVAVDYTAFVIRDSATGDPAALGVFARDATDRQAVEWALRESELRLRQKTKDLERTLSELKSAQSHMVQQEKMSGLGQLVAGVAHEINNPVNFIYGNLDHAKHYAQDLLDILELYRAALPLDRVPQIAERAEEIEIDYLVEDLPKLLASMKAGADRIKEIVRSLRIFSRMDESDMKDVDIHQGLDSTLTILNNRIKAKGDRSEIHIIKHYADLPNIECYPGQLNQVFMNILANAIDALEDASQRNADRLEITIETELASAGNRLQIRISDNGPGIPEVIRDRLFDPFFTTKPIGQGTGLGLSIAYQIVTEKHHGKLSVQSSPTTGTMFVIEIPTRQLA